MNDKNETERKLSRQEAHDLSMIIKDRTKVLKAHADEQAAVYISEFEQQLAQLYGWADGEVWRQAGERANEVIASANEVIKRKCEELGIPAGFAPTLTLDWTGRGAQGVKNRQAELRRVAKVKVEAMLKTTLTQIERQSLDLRTHVVKASAISPQANAFLESLAPVEETMRALSIGEIEKAIEDQKAGTRFAGLIYREPYE